MLRTMTLGLALCWKDHNKAPPSPVTTEVTLARCKTRGRRFRSRRTVHFVFHYPHYYHAPPSTPVSAVRVGNWKLLEYYEDEHVEQPLLPRE